MAEKIKKNLKYLQDAIRPGETGSISLNIFFIIADNTILI
jgi:hypothetical protein